MHLLLADTIFAKRKINAVEQTLKDCSPVFSVNFTDRGSAANLAIGISFLLSQPGAAFDFFNNLSIAFP